MSDQPDSETATRLTPTGNNGASKETEQLDAAGQTILKLLHKAAGVAEANSRHALEMAQKLSQQLRAAEDRIDELEAEIEIYREKADRAEQWLHKVYTEIEGRLIRRPEEKLQRISRPQ
jgi:predicted ribosome quality control (RQC) complex YloA/Tae2 family protein